MVDTIKQHLGSVALLVHDYDEAIAFYTTKMGFVLLQDTDLGAGKRWVQLSPPGRNGASLLLAKASKPEQTAVVGNQAGGRVFLFLHTNDFWRDYQAMVAKGVQFNELPREEPYGTVAVFEDLYGNKWDLLQLNAQC
ncbi:MAG: VOC family protein [Chromatiaceae bacterium]|nr:VOC family protein [Chromatiaceae bacterium]